MSSIITQIAAVVSVYHMRRHGFAPASVLNVGVGSSSPEVVIWQWLLPDANLLGVDPRWSPRGVWTKKLRLPQVAVGVGDGSIQEGSYCGKCRSMKCTDGLHGKVSVPMSTIDKVASDLEGPLFVWMDIDGSEVDALRGAKETLVRTGWINIECHGVIYGPEHASDIDAMLRDSGFRLEYRHHGCDDRLYRNIRL